MSAIKSAPSVQQGVGLHLDDEYLTIVLHEVQLENSGSEPDMEKFTTLFRIPAVVAYPQGATEPIVGVDALPYLESEPQNTIRYMRRLLGRTEGAHSGSDPNDAFSVTGRLLTDLQIGDNAALTAYLTQPNFLSLDRKESKHVVYNVQREGGEAAGSSKEVSPVEAVAELVRWAKPQVDAALKKRSLERDGKKVQPTQGNNEQKEEANKTTTDPNHNLTEWNSCVVAVPLSARDHFRQAMKDAVSLGGRTQKPDGTQDTSSKFDVLRIINEPTGSLIAVSKWRGMGKDDDSREYLRLVVHMSESSLTVTSYLMEDEIYESLGPNFEDTSGTMCGTVLCVERLTEEAMGLLKRRGALPSAGGEREKAKLAAVRASVRTQCVAIFDHLCTISSSHAQSSTKERTVTICDATDSAKTISVCLPESSLADLCGDIIRCVCTAVNSVIEELARDGYPAPDKKIDHIVFSGSRLLHSDTFTQRFQESVIKENPTSQHSKIVGSKVGQPEALIAQGCAIQCNILTAPSEPFMGCIFDVTAAHLSAELQPLGWGSADDEDSGRSCPEPIALTLATRNTTIPMRKRAHVAIPTSLAAKYKYEILFYQGMGLRSQEWIRQQKDDPAPETEFTQVLGRYELDLPALMEQQPSLLNRSSHIVLDLAVDIDANTCMHLEYTFVVGTELRPKSDEDVGVHSAEGREPGSSSLREFILTTTETIGKKPVVVPTIAAAGGGATDAPEVKQTTWTGKPRDVIQHQVPETNRRMDIQVINFIYHTDQDELREVEDARMEQLSLFTAVEARLALWEMRQQTLVDLLLGSTSGGTGGVSVQDADGDVDREPMTAAEREVLLKKNFAVLNNAVCTNPTSGEVAPVGGPHMARLFTVVLDWIRTKLAEIRSLRHRWMTAPRNFGKSEDKNKKAASEGLLLTARLEDTQWYKDFHSDDLEASRITIGGGRGDTWQRRAQRAMLLLEQELQRIYAWELVACATTPAEQNSDKEEKEEPSAAAVVQQQQQIPIPLLREEGSDTSLLGPVVPSWMNSGLATIATLGLKTEDVFPSASYKALHLATPALHFATPPPGLPSPYSVTGPAVAVVPTAGGPEIGEVD